MGYTIYAGDPVVAWAIQDEYPITASTFKVALVAVDNWQGVKSVEFKFDESVTKVGGATQANHTITSPTLIDLFGYGNIGEYWLIDIEVDSLSGDQTVVNVEITTDDDVVHNTTQDIANSRTIIYLPSETIIYLDGINGDDAEDGSTPEKAVETIGRANEVADVTADVVSVAEGTYDIPSTMTQDFRDKFLRWVAEAGPVPVFTTNSTVTYKWYQSFEGITINNQTGGVIRISAVDHVRFENCNWDWDNIDGSQLNIIIPGALHVAFINCTQTYGYRGFNPGWNSGVLTSEVLIHGQTITHSGTGGIGVWLYALIEFYTAYDCAEDQYAGGTHFGFIEGHAKVGTGAQYSWTEATKEITAPGVQFWSFIMPGAGDPPAVFAVTAGTNAVVGYYEIASKTSDSVIVLVEDITTAGTDETDIEGYADGVSMRQLIMRNCLTYDCGFDPDRSYTMFLQNGGTNGLAVYNNISFNIQLTQQIVTPSSSWRNVQVVHNTITSVDNDEEGDSRGINFSGQLAVDPYDLDGLLVRNNIAANLNESHGEHNSGNPPLPSATTIILGPNMYSKQTGTYKDTDGSFVTSTGPGLASLGLTDLSVSPYDFAPLSSSEAIGVGVLTDVKYDLYGNPFDAATPELGAVAETAGNGGGGTAARRMMAFNLVYPLIET